MTNSPSKVWDLDHMSSAYYTSGGVKSSMVYQVVLISSVKPQAPYRMEFQAALQSMVERCHKAYMSYLYSLLSRVYTSNANLRRIRRTILRTGGAYSRPPMPIYAVVIAQMASINAPTKRRRLRRPLPAF